MWNNRLGLLAHHLILSVGWWFGGWSYPVLVLGFEKVFFLKPWQKLGSNQQSPKPASRLSEHTAHCTLHTAYA